MHKVSTIQITKPLTILGKHFTGDYSKSPQFVTEVQNALQNENIAFTPYKVIGIYYDDPRETKPEELRSFHAVFPTDDENITKSNLESMSLEGKFLQVRVEGDPSKTIFEGYGSLFNYIAENNVKVKSNSGYQISSFENGMVTTEILMEI